ncbi:mitochondrial coenzyme A diphosphatase NUDT8 isoform X1 [Mobula birostris]|uniref:mitochondrial coenzyme A diphosphatase NUDT8 isoform X1 n=1 Tax=Mobula birostris TaxID=1983395 RepID=UPI003B2801DD
MLRGLPLPLPLLSAPSSRPLLSSLPSADAVSSCLSGASRERVRQRLTAAPASLAPRPAPGRVWHTAGILLPLCQGPEGDPSILLTLRSAQLSGRHQGDVSFPGGKQDRSDGDIVDTALRETEEEVGLRVSRTSVWGTLRPVPQRNITNKADELTAWIDMWNCDVVAVTETWTSQGQEWLQSGILVIPVLAHVGILDAANLRPNPAEVEDVFTVSISHLCTEQNRGYTRFRKDGRYAYTLPVFLNAKYKVWGLTAVVIESLLSLLFPGSSRAVC